MQSDKLYSIRREIRSLNERIRTRLSEYLTGEEGKYLQDGIITMRDNRYVLPVRAEYKRNIKGFHSRPFGDGATFLYRAGTGPRNEQRTSLSRHRTKRKRWKEF